MNILSLFRRKKTIPFIPTAQFLIDLPASGNVLVVAQNKELTETKAFSDLLSFPGGNSSSEHQPVPLLTQEKHLRGFLTDVIDCAFSSTRQHTDRQLYSTFGPGPTQQLPLFHREA